MPPWLTFDASQFVFSGVPTDTEATLYKFTLVVTSIDNPANSQTIALMIPVRIGMPVAFADQSGKPKAPHVVANASGGIVLQTADGGMSEAPAAVPAADANQSPATASVYQA